MLAHVKAVREFRALALESEIGVVLNLTPSYTRNDSAEDQKRRGMRICSSTAASSIRW